MPTNREVRLANPLPGRTALKMDNNLLLIKPQLGRTRPTVYDLPPEDHIYGQIVERNPLDKAEHSKYIFTNNI